MSEQSKQSSKSIFSLIYLIWPMGIMVIGAISILIAGARNDQFQLLLGGMVLIVGAAMLFLLVIIGVAAGAIMAKLTSWEEPEEEDSEATLAKQRPIIGGPPRG